MNDLGEGCDHGIVFDEEAATDLLKGWQATDAVSFIVGNPASAEVKKRWPRGWFDEKRPCPKGCGFRGIYYASMAHYRMGDW